MNVFPVGHYVGERHPEAVHLVRVGLAHRTLSEAEFGVWVLAHGVAESPAWTLENLLALAEKAGLPGARAAADRLAGTGVLVIGNEVALARTHRFVPLLVGLGNTEPHPDRCAVGLPGQPVAVLDESSFELWQWGHLAPSLWHTCEVRAEVAGSASAREELDGVLRDLRPLLVGGCGYLDVLHPADQRLY
ncbi:hypothetical protein [Nocardia sp. NRRL S-836]|uniref:hypothetical protein n=1 Tax=Nocardia sp. NRRL S-836 TaxID=1519492 RepID=UPI0006AEE528|nr:hypothetical protein [Nocardia sp. NRRL S-836]KOV87225.1 hypothetical protein ADL03_07760 [Nocardia sp. NRRL S-836]